MNRTLASRSASAEETDYRVVFEHSPVMLCIADLDGRIIEANGAFIETLGYSADEVARLSFHELAHPADQDAAISALASLADGAAGVSFDNRGRRQDGSYCWLSWNARRDAAGRLLYCSVLDVSARREHGEVVAKLLADLERSNTDLAQFAYVASHDLSEPLRMVSSYVQLLADRYSGRLDSDADEFIAFAVDGANRMKALIDDLLAYSRAGASGLVRRPVDCGALVRGALGDLDRVVAASGATIVVGDLPVVTGDPGQLALLFQNLLANALKFVADDAPPHIAVSAQRVPEGWCFAVEDHGIGIPELHRERIFLMFKRLHGRGEYPGTGIGLALCRKIVSRLGGRIWVEPADDHGTVFRFTVPDDEMQMEARTSV